MTTTKRTTPKVTNPKKIVEEEFKRTMMGFLTEEGTFSDENGFPVKTSYYKDGFTYRTSRCGSVSTGIVHIISKTTGTCNASEDDYRFENARFILCQSNNIRKSSFEITAYHDCIIKQTVCKLCYSFDNRVQPSSCFNRKRHGKSKMHQKNKKKCMDAVMDITKQNYDVANVILSFL
jgi:hypothetical protein